MNYLAHAFLSFNNDDVLLGNMISDYVKGKTKYTYTEQVQWGINLHREIDAYTDAHPVLNKTKQIFKPTYRLYSGAFIDVVLDHFLAKNLLTKIDLLQFTQTVYTSLAKNVELMPLPFQKMFPNMQQNNWLYNYQYTWGIQKSFVGLQRRAAYITEVETAYQLFEQHYAELQNSFNLFWTDVYTFTQDTYKKLSNFLPTPHY